MCVKITLLPVIRSLLFVSCVRVPSFGRYSANCFYILFYHFSRYPMYLSFWNFYVFISLDNFSYSSGSLCICKWFLSVCTNVLPVRWDCVIDFFAKSKTNNWNKSWYIFLNEQILKLIQMKNKKCISVEKQQQQHQFLFCYFILFHSLYLLNCCNKQTNKQI